MTNFLHLVRDQINKIYPKRKKKNIIKERYREWLCRNFNNMHIRLKKKKAKTISLGKNISKHVYARFQEEFYRDDLNSSAARITNASHARSYFLSKESDGSDNIIIVLFKLVFILDMLLLSEEDITVLCFFFFLNLEQTCLVWGHCVSQN